MPSTSPAQHRLMLAAAHDPAFARRIGVPQGVGAEFVSADRHYATGGGVQQGDGGDPVTQATQMMQQATAPATSSASWANQLPPDLLAQLHALQQGQTLDYGGNTYAPIGIQHTDEGGTSFDPNGYTAFTTGTDLKPGAQGAEYGLQGGLSSSPYTVQNGNAFKLSDFKDFGQMAATLFSMYAAGAGLAAAGAGAAGGIGGSGFAAGAGGAGAADATAGAAAAFNPAIDSQLANVALGPDAFAGYGIDGAGSLTGGGVFNAGYDSQLANAGITASGGDPLVGYGATGGADAATSSVFNPAQDSQAANVDIANAGGDPLQGYVNNPVSTNPTISNFSPNGTGPGTDVGSLSGSGSSFGSQFTSWLSNPTNALKLLTSLGVTGSGSGSGNGAGGGTQQPASYQSHEIDPGYNLVTPGWRSDRPMYVPGQDAVPDGWYGAGHTA